jgi:hypothetical protein
VSAGHAGSAVSLTVLPDNDRIRMQRGSNASRRDSPFQLHSQGAEAMGKSKDKDTKKMVKKEPTKTPKERKEAKKLKKEMRKHG